MVFSELLAAGAFPVALEITPPQKPLPKVLMRRAALLGPAARAINVIQRPGRQSSLDASLHLQATGIQPVWHLVVRGRTREDLAADFARAAAGGIRQVLCIRGDHAGETAGALTIRDTVLLAAESLPGATIGVTFDQYLPNPDRVLRNLWPKLDAGASYVQTQPVFSVDLLEEMADRIKQGRPETRVVTMAMPLLSLAAAEKIEARIGLALPPELRHRLEAGGDPWEAFDETMAALVASPLVDAVAVMTFEMDAPPLIGARIVESLRNAGVDCPLLA